MTELIVTERRGALQLIRFNRPEKKNALTQAMYGAAAAALAAGEADEAIAVQVILGAGGDFTAGNDLDDFLRLERLAGTPLEAFLSTLTGLAKPIVAAVKGAAVGIGSTLLLHCDLVVAAEGTRFQFPFVNLGLVPEAGSSLLLPRLAGYQRAAELMLLGEPFDAGMAAAIGLVNRVVPAGAEETEAFALAGRLAARPARVVRQIKALLKAGDESLSARIERERLVFEANLTSWELQEAVAAFKERRPADFSRGRAEQG